MKLASTLNKFCKDCQKHVEHIVSKVKKGQVSKMTWIQRQKERYGDSGNKGKFSKKPTKRFKNAKRPHIKLTCTVCKMMKNLALKRATKFEIVKK